MKNAEKFLNEFGIYATELWAKPEKAFLEWLNADVPDTNVGDMIYRQAAIDAVGQYISQFDAIDANFLDGLKTAINIVKKLPSAQPNIKDAISAIRQFLDGGKFITTCKFITEDGVCLMTDWGYFEEGLDELERYAEKGAKNEGDRRRRADSRNQ